MKFLSLFVLLVLCTLSQAISFSTVATVSLTLISLNKPVSCFFGIFRRRKSPVQETAVPAQNQMPFSFPNQPMPGGFMNRFGFGGGSMFFPGANNPVFGLFNPSNRFPPQVKPPPPTWTPQRPQMPSPQVQPGFPSRPPIPQFPPQGMPPGMHQFPQGMPPGMHQFPQGMSPGMHQFPQVMSQFPQDMPHGMDELSDAPEDNDVPGMNTEEAESFFTLLSETDESKCISRLICEMGSNPESGGEFGQTIVEIIGSLNDFPDGSRVSEYNEVLNFGSSEGLSACVSKFSICDEESFQLVKKAQLEDSQSD